MAVLVLGGTPVAAPTKLRVVIADISSKQERNAAGTTVIDRITRKRRIECEWSFVSASAMATLLGAAGKTTSTFSVAYHDPEDNATKTITCFVASREMGAAKYSSGVPIGWEQVKISFEEQ